MDVISFLPMSILPDISRSIWLIWSRIHIGKRKVCRAKSVYALVCTLVPLTNSTIRLHATAPTAVVVSVGPRGSNRSRRAVKFTQVNHSPHSRPLATLEISCATTSAKLQWPKVTERYRPIMFGPADALILPHADFLDDKVTSGTLVDRSGTTINYDGKMRSGVKS